MVYNLIDNFSHSVKYHLTKLKSYRRYKGGNWYFVYPEKFPEFSYWTTNKSENEIIIEFEIYS